MRIYAICLICLIGLTSGYGQTTVSKVCWDTRWFNNHVPTQTNRSDYENPPTSVLDSICANGTVIAATCRDEKGEPFTGYRNSHYYQFIVTCNVVTGLVCNPYNNSHSVCPDFEIRYGCACPTSATSTKIVTSFSSTLSPIRSTAKTTNTVSTITTSAKPGTSSSSTMSPIWSTAKTRNTVSTITTSVKPGTSSLSTILSTAKTTNTVTTISTKIKLEDAINVKCTESDWNITVNMALLRLLYPSIKETDLYFGQNKCQGHLLGSSLMFQQHFNICSTTVQLKSDREIFQNKLFYVIFDPINPFVVRQHKWTFAVECDVMNNEVTSSHVDHNVETHNATFTNHHPVAMAFFSDIGFKNQIAGSPLQVNFGENVFVKVFTTLSDWDIKMRLNTCYTTPSGSSTRNMDVILIEDGCEIDSNTHIISQSTHETRFLFKDFEYFNNNRGFDVLCNATFCHSNDFSARCSQSCHSTHNPNVV